MQYNDFLPVILVDDVVVCKTTIIEKDIIAAIQASAAEAL
jgi:hypothetical protein